MANKATAPEKPFVPLNEVVGRCGCCGGCNFRSKVYRGNNPKFKELKGHIIRTCLFCEEVLDSDTEKVLRKGEKKNGFQ